MDLVEALHRRLNGVPGLAAVGDRVSWMQRNPGEGLPALVPQLVSEERPQQLDGFEDMRSARVQLAAMSFDFLEARALREAALAALVPAAELTAIAPDTGLVQFWEAEVAGIRDLSEDVEGQGAVFRALADLIIRYAVEA